MAAPGHVPFQWVDLLKIEYFKENPHVGAAAVGVFALILAGVSYRAVTPKAKAANKKDEELVPPANLKIRNLFDLIGSFVQDIAISNIGSHYKKFLPILLFIFIWTLLNNLLGSIPGFGSTTDNLNTTIAMGLVVFLYYNIQGFRSHGIKYLEHFTGHLHGSLLLFLGPIMFVIELISHSVRPLTLGIRLRSNIYGDHTVFGIFSGLLQDLAAFMGENFGFIGGAIGSIVASVGPIPIILLGLMVAFIQAFVFTLLTAIYLGLATSHEEH